jgi:hypothetical protein
MNLTRCALAFSSFATLAAVGCSAAPTETSHVESTSEDLTLTTCKTPFTTLQTECTDEGPGGSTLCTSGCVPATQSQPSLPSNATVIPPASKLAGMHATYGVNIRGLTLQTCATITMYQNVWAVMASGWAANPQTNLGAAPTCDANMSVLPCEEVAPLSLIQPNPSVGEPDAGWLIVTESVYTSVVDLPDGGCYITGGCKGGCVIGH